VESRVDDAALVGLAQRGDSRAFAVLAGRHERSLYCTAYSLLGSSWDAADAVQDAFTEVYSRLGTLRDPDRFGAWISRIVVNRCYDTHRRRKRSRPVDSPLDGEAYEFHGPEVALDLMAALHDLDDDHRAIIALRYFRDLKVHDIAEVLGCPEGTVKSRLNRAMGALRCRLERTEEVEVLR